MLHLLRCDRDLQRFNLHHRTGYDGAGHMNKTFVPTWLCLYFAAIAELCGCLDVLLDIAILLI